MWQGVLDIAHRVGERWNVDLATDIRHELMVRESFHVFEMNAGAARKELAELRGGLARLGLFSHPVPWGLYLLDYLLGRRARPLYRIARVVVQR
jgi:hypothetical protein